MADLLARLLLLQSGGLVFVYLAVIAAGGVLYVAMSMSTKSASSSVIAVRRPGWIARRRARRGVHQPKAGAAIGYASATR